MSRTLFFAGALLLLVGSVNAVSVRFFSEGTGDCSQYLTCATCAGINNCGWCSTPIEYSNGTLGPQCASPGGTPFTCNGIYSTSQCIKGYTCDQTTGKCNEAPPGQGVQKDTCEAACTVGPTQKVYGCLPGTHTCVEVPGGTPGSASKAECEKHCYTPSAKVYACNASGGVCVVVPPGTPGSSSKEVCEATGCDFGTWGCDLTSYKCAEGLGNASKHYCDADCRPPNDPCEQYNTCDTCLAASSVCGWCSQNVTYVSGQVGSQCAGVNASILPFQCLGTYSTKLCNNPTTLVPSTLAPVPTTPSPTFSPTLPPNNRPYLRFGHTIPTSHKVNAKIVQGTTSYEWKDYPFAKFSHWVEIFAVGDAVVTIYDAATGKSLVSTTISLTPGPLVIVTKDYWPPAYPYNIEVIAASYPPAKSGSGVRLFNLSPDTPSADMSSGGVTLVLDILYSLGSVWAPISNGTASYTATNSATGATIATDSFTAPPAPYVFTNFLVGLANTTDATKKARLVALVDAPE